MSGALKKIRQYLHNACRLLTIWLVLGVIPAQAQSLHTAISVQAKITPKLNATVFLSRRSYDKFRGTSSSTLSVSSSYTFSPHLSTAAGTALVMNHTHEKELVSGDIRPSFWQPRWRTFVSISPRVSFGKFNAFYRSRWQILVKGDKTVTLQPSGDIDVIEGETTFTWAHRLYAERPSGHFTPYVSFDLFNAMDDKFKITHYQFALGSYYFLTPKNRFGLFCRKIFRPDGVKPANGLVVIGVTYQQRFSL